MDNPRVLVVGAGPVGQLAALALAGRGVPVRIVDTGVWPCKHSYALAIHPQSLELLDQFGMKDRLLAASYPVFTIGLYDGSARQAEIKVASPDAPHQALAVVRQDFLEDAFEQALNEAGVKVNWRHDVAGLSVANGAVTATINRLERESRGYIVAHNEWVVGKSMELEVPYVIGADGYNSRVRRALSAEFPEVGPAQYFAVFEFQTASSPGHEMRIVLDGGLTSVFWPLSEHSCRWSFQLPEYHDTEAEQFKDRMLAAGFGYFPTERPKDREGVSGSKSLPVLDEDQLHKLLAARAPWFNAGAGQIAWRTVVRFERRLSSTFGQGSVWLAGDSAHLTGPAGIQSMNAGLFEAADLAAAIADGSPSGLEAYRTRWSAVWRRLHNLDGGLRALPSASPWIAKHAPSLLSCLPAQGKPLDALAAQLQLTF